MRYLGIGTKDPENIQIQVNNMYYMRIIKLGKLNYFMMMCSKKKKKKLFYDDLTRYNQLSFTITSSTNAIASKYVYPYVTHTHIFLPFISRILSQ